MITPVAARDVEALLMFGEANELVRISPLGESIRFGAAATPAEMAALVKKASQSLTSGVQKTLAPIAAPVGGKITVAVPTKAASGTVNVQAKAPKLAQLAPAATKPTATASLSTPKPVAAAAAGKLTAPAKVTTPKPAPAVTAPANVATSALQGNFLEPGSAPLAAPNVLASYGVGLTQAQRDANARALLEAQSQANAAASAAYARLRQADTAASMQTVTDGVQQSWEKAGTDVDQLLMGAKVLAVMASIIASGGAAAGAVGVTTAGGALASAAAADRLVAAVEKGAELGKQAKSVIDDAKAAAAKGDAAAKQAVSVLNSVAKERIEKMVPKGVAQTVTATAQKAFDAVAGAVKNGVADQVLANLRAVGAAQVAAASSSGYTPIATTSQRPTIIAPVNQTTAHLLASLDLGTPRQRWFVSDAGGLTNLYKSPAPPGRGWTVWTTGEVVRT